MLSYTCALLTKILSLTLSLSIVNVVYDLTPASMVSLVATEIGLLPPTAVAAILREFQSMQSAP